VATPIRHGTRAGYKRGCTQDNMCQPNEHGITCRQASNKYQKDLRDLRMSARTRSAPIHARTSPKAPGIRVTVVPPSTEGFDPQDYPQGDIPTHEAPESLSNARVTPDPEPGESPNDIPDFIITPGIRNDIAGKLGLFAAIIGMPLEAIDPYCGPIFANNVDNMINSYLPIICRSPGAVKFFQSTSGGWLDWIRALQATWPVIQAAYAHHLSRSVGRDTRTPPDATRPPMPQDNYEYSAA
jgi:hypothetical protein